MRLSDGGSYVCSSDLVAALSFGSFAVMAVMLEPRDFGVVALAGVPVYFLLMLVGHSFSDALVQREAIDREHIDTAFWATTGLGLLSVAACAAMADPLSALFGDRKSTRLKSSH